jgi:HlyD family secretion protein
MTKPFESRHSIYRHLIAGSTVGFVLVAGLVGWAWTTDLAGAVIAPGVVVVESDVKKVQHPTGGVVGELNVRDDDYVQNGDVLIRLDETQSKANVAVFSKSLDELRSRQARLDAEKNSSDSVQFPAELLARERGDAELSHILEGERKLFGLRVEARRGEKAQLRERALQLREEVKGLDEQIRAKTEEIGLISEELNGVMDLWQKQLIPFTRVTALKRDAARLEGERGQLVASKASSGGKIAEVELQIIQVDDDARSKVAEELSEVRAKIAELSERKIAAEDQLKRIDIRAPQTGHVHQLTVHTVGQVISPGETIMLIVPDHDALSVEARVSPTDIDQLRPDQTAVLRFSAFNTRTTPEINGTVRWISADVTKDEHSGAPYYTLRIAVPRTELARLNDLKIVPGMPVETFIQTEPRTALSYVLKPLTDQVKRTFREN